MDFSSYAFIYGIYIIHRRIVSFWQTVTGKHGIFFIHNWKGM